LDEYGDRCAIGEIWYELPRWIKYYGENGAGLNLPFNFRLIYVPWKAQSIRQSIEEMESTLPAFAWPNYVLGNHDIPRLASRIGQAQTRVAAMLLLTLRGTPTWYYGDELGLENGVIPPEKIQDPQGIRLGPRRSRDIARTPMQWDDRPFAGFSNAEPWLLVSDDFAYRNVKSESDDPTSILNLFRRLSWLRSREQALHGGSITFIDRDDQDCLVYLRRYGTERFLIALNISPDTQTIEIPGERKGELVLTTYLDRQGQISLSPVTLRPDEGILIRLG
jgi:alpha-glucosidase